MGNATKLFVGPSQLTKNIAYMVNKAISANDRGEIFPIMAVCLGHEALMYILSDYDPVKNHKII